jgi:hypothetical protein
MVPVKLSIFLVGGENFAQNRRPYSNVLSAAAGLCTPSSKPKAANPMRRLVLELEAEE